MLAVSTLDASMMTPINPHAPGKNERNLWQCWNSLPDMMFCSVLVYTHNVLEHSSLSLSVSMTCYDVCMKISLHPPHHPAKNHLKSPDNWLRKQGYKWPRPRCNSYGNRCKMFVHLLSSNQTKLNLLDAASIHAEPIAIMKQHSY